MASVTLSAPEPQSPGMAAGLLILLVLSHLVFLLFKYGKQGRRQLPLPPKAPGAFLIGNTLDMIKAAKNNTAHLLMKRLADEHEEIFRFQVGSVTDYFLNSDRAVKVRRSIQTDGF